MDEHLVEFIASSVLTAIMTYANWRLSAEMRLFSRKDACTPKMGRAMDERWRRKKRRRTEEGCSRALIFVSICCCQAVCGALDVCYHGA